MKISFLKFLAGAMVSVFVTTAHALPITGDIGFTGNVTFDAPIGTATEIIGYSTVFVTGGSQTGAYAAVPDFTWATWTPFVFNPPAANVVPLWTFTLGAITYSFDATSVSVEKQVSNELNLSGSGIAKITGYDDTVGTWTFNAGGPGTIFSFAAGTSVSSVPDGGFTFLLLGVGLLVVFLLQRKTSAAAAAHV